ncbi:MAG: carboxypeptidase regulatory-like domain-containing protein, partial [Acidobacteria bacterium]|nr:carboxypeptidase regulatory-like domain-containing protein [Acidobacteriota bacterium]
VVTFTISGRIANGANGLPGVTVTLSGSQSAQTSTDANGNYSFASLAQGGSFTVTPALAGFTFVPPSQTFNNLQANQTADFAANAVAVTFIISGRVTNASAVGVPGALITLSGSQAATTNTDANGDYSFASLAQGGNFTVTPSFAGFTFTPPSRTFNNLQANQTGADFTTNAVTHTLSGRVADSGGQGILGINLTLSGTQSAVTTTDAAGNYSFTGLANGGNFTLTPSETNFRFVPVSRQVNNLQADVGGVDFTGRLVNHTITGRIVDAQGNGIPDVLVTLSGALSAVTRTDQQGNFVFNDVPTSGSFNITPEKVGFTFEPRRQNVTGINSDVQFEALGVVQPSPTPTPDPSDDFSGTQIDFERWIIGILTNPPPAFDPLVSVFQSGGLLHIQPRADANGPSYSGLVSIRTIDLNASPAVSVEVVQAAQGEATQTIFGLGTNDDNWFRFVVEDASTTAPQSASSATATAGTKQARGASSSSSAAPSATPTPAPQNLLFQISIGGTKFSTGPLAFDPALHRFWRFRHDAPARLILFETSPDAQNWTERFRANIDRGQTALIAELSAGTSRASRNPSEALFDNFLLSPSPRLQFTTRGASASEGGGTISINVLRTGSAESPVSVDFATGGGTATPGTDYAATSGTLTFGVNERLKTISVPLFNDALEEPDETIDIALSNPVGGGLGSVVTATLTILDDDRARNSIDESEFFVRQHYRDFLGRDPDAAGLAFWVNNIESCGADAQCRDIRRVDTSAAFFLSIEFQETGYFVHR